MIRQGILICIALLLGTIVLKGQNEREAMLFSQTNENATARFSSMGGAFTALGGDMSSLSQNPAGIAIFRKSEFNFGIGLFKDKTSTLYLGTSANDNKYNFNLANIGLVAAYNQTSGKNQQGWLGFNFGISYNRTANFNSNMVIEGMNTQNSLLDHFTQNAQGYTPTDLTESGMSFYEGLAWETYLLDTTTNNTLYTNPINGLPIAQSKTINTKGSSGETAISFGGNYSNRLYLGASVGITRLRYKEESQYIEKDVWDTIPNFHEYTMNENLNISGTGFNFKFGFIYWITEWARIGGALHTPNFYTMNRTWSSSIESTLNGQNYSAESPQGEYDYEFSTPLKAMGGIAFLIAKKGLVSFDYEMVDYSEASYDSDGYDYLNENRQIRDKFEAAHNIKIGAEYVANPIALRAGYSLYGNPYGGSLGIDGERENISFGFGIREQGYYIDFAYIISNYKSIYYLYDPDMAQPTDIEKTNNLFMLTLGFRW